MRANDDGQWEHIPKQGYYTITLIALLYDGISSFIFIDSFMWHGTTAWKCCLVKPLFLVHVYHLTTVKIALLDAFVRFLGFA